MTAGFTSRGALRIYSICALAVAAARERPRRAVRVQRFMV